MGSLNFSHQFVKSAGAATATDPDAVVAFVNPTQAGGASAWGGL
jgi:hypothetical protein